MLTISPSFDRDTLAPYCRRCGAVYSEEYYLYRALDGGEVLAAALFWVSGDAVTARLYEAAQPHDVFLFDGVLRAGLNYAAEQGIENGVIPEPFRTANGTLFAKLNYPAQPQFNITNFFQKYKNCASR